MAKTWREPLGKSLKIAVAALLAIALAGELGLKYSATAGIITVLSIQNTKRETIKSARNRALAFAGALVLAALFYSMLGFRLWAFAAYLFFFALICFLAGWQEAIAMDSVLISHFLAEQNMGTALLANEVLLFVIGTGLGILVNLHLHPREQEFSRLAEQVDMHMKEILRFLSRMLTPEGESRGTDGFDCLAVSLREAGLQAAANYNNALFGETTAELDYIHMREKQSLILKEIYENIQSIPYLPSQAGMVSEFILNIEREFHRDNTVEQLLKELEQFLSQMQKQPLPEKREEFEARAILFYILMQLKSLLELKRNFVVQQKSKGNRERKA